MEVNGTILVHMAVEELSNCSCRSVGFGDLSSIFCLFQCLVLYEVTKSDSFSLIRFICFVLIALSLRHCWELFLPLRWCFPGQRFDVMKCSIVLFIYSAIAASMLINLLLSLSMWCGVATGSTFVLVVVGSHPGAFFHHRLWLHRVCTPAIGRVLCAEDGISLAEDAVVIVDVFTALHMLFYRCVAA